LFSVDGVNLIGIEPKVDVATVAFRERLGAIAGLAGIGHGMTAERAVKHELHVLWFEAERLSGGHVESQANDNHEGVARDPGDLMFELLLRHG
jgi:predicted NAD/FAD-binding protein